MCDWLRPCYLLCVETLSIYSMGSQKLENSEVFNFLSDINSPRTLDARSVLGTLFRKTVSSS